MSKEYLDTVKRLEPDIHPLDMGAAIASIAVSMKRQADALDRIAAALEPGISDCHPAVTVADQLFELVMQGRNR